MGTDVGPNNPGTGGCPGVSGNVIYVAKNTQLTTQWVLGVVQITPVREGAGCE